LVLGKAIDMPSVIQLKRTTVQFKNPRPPKAVIRAAIAGLSSPPADHNISGLPSLSPEESICVEQARAALASVKRTFEFWVALARGLAMLRAKADAIGGSFTFARLREREGFGGLHRATVHNLTRLHERLPEVEAWRATLTERERFRWAGPEVILRHCPAFTRPNPARAAKPPRIEPTASVDAIATVLIGMFTPAKAEAIFRAGLAKLAART
jgi:hypothetical protein